MGIMSLIKNRIKTIINHSAETEFLKGEINRLRNEKRILANETIDLMLRYKKEHGEKVKVVFICHRPAIWGSLKSVYESMKKDDVFDVSIIAIPNKKQLPGSGLAHEIYESEGAEEFFAPMGCMNGYDYETGEWLDPRVLSPDYVFIQTPYNIAHSRYYQSDVISTYAKIAYIAYFPVINLDEVYDECFPLDFAADLSFYFSQIEEEDVHAREWIGSSDGSLCQVICTGYPRYDQIMDYLGSNCDIWNSMESFKILWNTRWTTNEGNCNFFRYKDRFVELLKSDSSLELTYRPHPQAFSEWLSTGEMTQKELSEFIALFQNSNMHLDQSDDYNPLLFSSDCLITDRSSLIADYICTLKPIIYCKGTGGHFMLLESLMDAVYIVDDWDGLTGRLTELRNGIDPLKDKRIHLLKELYHVGDLKVGEKIKDIIKEDSTK